MMDQTIGRPTSRAGASPPARRRAETERFASAPRILERVAWIAAFPVYVTMAVVITLVFANAALVTELRSRGGEPGDQERP